MIAIASVVGNIRSEKKLNDVYRKLDHENKVERLLLSRMEAERSRIRRSTDAATDIAINLKHGLMLKHGDVLLLEDSKMIIVEYEVEDVLGVKIKDELSTDQKIATGIKLGHVFGNLHRPICTRDNITYVPVQTESEIAHFKEILSPIIDCINIHHTKIIFEQDEGAKVHEH
ncbi:MAG: urease accessory protein UreE [Nitrososphaerales archaeon]